ncbi:MAG: cobalamin-binding protein [Actinomycetota bacterium]|nr:cobalamin-binding protein [Actinomycetota bacterium]
MSKMRRIFAGIKVLLVLLLVVSLCIGAFGCAKKKAEVALEGEAEKVEKAAFPIELADDLGRKVTIDKKPERIVSLAPSNTEILFALGLDDSIVGVTDFCDYPEEAKSKEKIGGFSDPNIEKIVEVKPDLILATGMHQKILGQLENVGLTVFVLDSKGIGGVIDGIEKIGKLTGEEEAAQEVVSEMRRKMNEVEEKVAGLSDEQKPLVYYEVWNDPIMTVGPGALMYEIIQVAGGKNIAADAQEEYPKLSLEVLIGKNPQVIIASKGSMGDPGKVKERKGWEDISAVKEGKVYIIDEDKVVRAGPRVVDGLVEVAKILHSELFQ